MRSHKKLTLIIAAAVLPNLAFGLGPDLDPADAAKAKKEPPAATAPATAPKASTPAGYLNFAAAKAAFGDDFGAEKSKDGAFVTLYGLTSEKCYKDAFEIKSDAAKGEYAIFYKGGHEDCLDGKKQVTSATPLSDIARLSAKDEVKMKLGASFEALRLRYENPLSDRDRVKYDALSAADGAPISHTSAAELAEKKKKENEAKVAQRLEDSMKFVATCGRNLDELDLMGEVLDELEGVAAIAESKKTELSAARKRRNERIFAACKLQITRGRTDDLANCGERLKRLALEDESYVSKVKSVYLDLVGRLMNSTRLSMEEAYDSATEVIALIREFDLSEKEEKDLLAAERNVLFHFLRKGAMEGAESENFKLMREKAVEFMLAEDAEECLTEEGALDPRKRMAAVCQPAAQMAAMLQQNTQLAVTNQYAINAKVAADERAAKDQMLLGACRVNLDAKVAMSPQESAECNRVISEADAKAKAAANAGVSTNGFGQSVNPQNAAAPTNSAANPQVANGYGDSGLLNSSLYSGQQPSAPANVQPQSNAPTSPAPAAVAPNPTVNRTLGRR